MDNVTDAVNETLTGDVAPAVENVVETVNDTLAGVPQRDA